MRRTTRAAAVAACVTGSLLVAAPPVQAALGDPPNGSSGPGVLSADGRYVAFVSAADNLLDGDASLDPNGVADAFVLDTVTGEVDLVSARNGTPANGETTEVDISADGRYVAFVSSATNLLDDDTNGVQTDVFVADRESGDVVLASRRGVAGQQSNGESWNVSISSDGTRVAFTSYGSNLVGADSNDAADAFVRDLAAATTTRVSTSSTGKQANAATQYVGISGNGNVVGFASSASNLVTGDNNGRQDVFVKVLATGKTTRVSLTNGDKQAKGASTFYDLSSTGRYVAFSSDAANLVTGDTNAQIDAFVRDRTDGTTTRVSRRGTTQANGRTYGVAISPDGAYVAFTTGATNLGLTADGNGTAADVFEFEMATKELRLVSADAEGAWGDAASFDPSYGPATAIAFSSFATDLVGDATGGVGNVYVRSYGETRDDATTACRSLPAPAV